MIDRNTTPNNALMPWVATGIMHLAGAARVQALLGDSALALRRPTRIPEVSQSGEAGP